VGIDSRLTPLGYRVFQFTGDSERTRDSGRDTLAWAREVQARGAGEIVLNCMGSDGMQNGYDIEQLAAVRACCDVPLVASGGAGSIAHFRDVFAHRGCRCCARRERISFRCHQYRESEARPAHRRNRGAAVIHGTPLTLADVEDLDFSKGAGLLPAIVQDADSGTVLMLGYMNAAALRATLEASACRVLQSQQGAAVGKGRDLRTYIWILAVRTDCDRDALLVSARARGPVCHLGTTSCFGDPSATPASRLAFLSVLESVIERRITERPMGATQRNSWDKELKRIAQKVGEEGLELALAAAAETDERVIAEAADLIFHMMVLLKKPERAAREGGRGARHASCAASVSPHREAGALRHTGP
jgi:phosphoribosyl-ATP pyrophosphohydrolase/phosphoribosyl-AMP cyclohydrolase